MYAVTYAKKTLFIIFNKNNANFWPYLAFGSHFQISEIEGQVTCMNYRWEYIVSNKVTNNDTIKV